MTIEELKAKVAESLGVNVETLDNPFQPNLKLPQPVKYYCNKHGWWFPQDHICCPHCNSGWIK